MAHTLGEPNSLKICPATAYIQLFRWRPTCDHLVAHQPQPQPQNFPGIRNPRRAGPYLRALYTHGSQTSLTTMEEHLSPLMSLFLIIRLTPATLTCPRR